MNNTYAHQIPTYQVARAIQTESGRPNPEIKELQFWYNSSKDLIMVLTVTNNESQFAAIQVVEIRRAIIDLYPRRDFERFTYAPFILTKTEQP